MDNHPVADGQSLKETIYNRENTFLMRSTVRRFAPTLVLCFLLVLVIGEGRPLADYLTVFNFSVLIAYIMPTMTDIRKRLWADQIYRQQ